MVELRHHNKLYPNRWNSGHFSIFQDGGHTVRQIEATDDYYSVVSITVQNLVGIDTVVSTMWTLLNFACMP